MRHAPTGRIGNPDALGREAAQTTSAPGSRRSPTLNRTRRLAPLGPGGGAKDQSGAKTAANSKIRRKTERPFE